jgi:hypothetical protein
MSRRYTKKKNKRRALRKKSKKVYIKRGGAENSGQKPFNFFNTFHYGDNILNLKFLFNISPILKKRGIKINYYFDDIYNKREELERFVDKEAVTLHPLHDKPGDAVGLWMGANIYNGAFVGAPGPPGSLAYREFDIYYRGFYQIIVDKLGLKDENIDVSLYQPEPYLQDIYNGLDEKFKDLDILIINAEPKSMQYKYDKAKMDRMCVRLKDKYKVAVTTCVDDSIPCTMKDNLMLKDIGAISTHAKNIISVHTGPLATCYNSTTKGNVKKWLVLGDDVEYKEADIKILKSDYDLDNIEKELV